MILFSSYLSFLVLLVCAQQKQGTLLAGVAGKMSKHIYCNEIPLTRKSWKPALVQWQAIFTVPLLDVNNDENSEKFLM